MSFPTRSPFCIFQNGISMGRKFFRWTFFSVDIIVWFEYVKIHKNHFFDGVCFILFFLLMESIIFLRKDFVPLFLFFSSHFFMYSNVRFSRFAKNNSRIVLFYTTVLDIYLHIFKNDRYDTWSWKNYVRHLLHSSSSKALR